MEIRFEKGDLWSTRILKEFSKKGYIIDKIRMKNGIFFDEDYYK
ncbi:MAG: virulence RhuM family protein [Bacilli bacterium]|nr:virulence RhuM family protein [Bacilli bacterium]